MRSQFDVAVVGGGPAGATAALVAAEQGLSVCLLEAHALPREKLCGGLLSRKTMQIVNRLYGADAPLLTAAGIINYSTRGYDVVYDGTLLCSGSYAYPFHFVTRCDFDAWLLGHAERAGVRIRTGCAVTVADAEHGVLTLADGETVRATHIIGADGAKSVVRRAFPVCRKTWAKDVAATVEVRIPREMYPAPVERPQVHIGPVAEGYGWVFPNREDIVVGLGGKVAPGENLAALFRAFLSGLQVPDAQTLTFRGHPLPFGRCMEPPVHGRALLAGDAGGMVEPVFGEGIYFAIRSGEAAALAVGRAIRRNDAPLPYYMDGLRTDVLAEIAGSRRMQRILYFFDRRGLNPLVKFGVKLGSHVLLDIVHGRRSFSSLRQTGR